MENWFVDILKCPETGFDFILENNKLVRSDGKIFDSTDGIFSLVYPEAISGDNKKMNQLYEKIAPYYDFTERVIGRILTGVNISKWRGKIIELLKLTKGMTVLEVSPGPGVFTGIIRKAIGIDGRIVSVDLSQNMLIQCKNKQNITKAELLRGNAEYLPIKDSSFDAIFHFGGVNLFSHPEQALNEFVRVIKPGGIVAYGDEEMSAAFKHPIGKRILPKMNPGFMRAAPCPPSGMIDIVKHEVYDGLGYLMVGFKKSDCSDC